METDRPVSSAPEIATRLLSNVETVVRGKTEEIRLVLTALVCGGHVLLEDVPGTAKTVLARAIAGSVDGAVFSRIQCTPDLQPTDVTGLSDLQPARPRLRVPAGPGLRERPPRRRDQPRDAEDAVGAARGDGRAAGDDRRRHPRAARAVPRARDREPDRAGGHVPAAGGAARPLLPPHGARLPVGGRRGRDRRAAAERPSTRARCGRCSRSRRSQALRAAVETVYIDPVIRRWVIQLVRATREADGVAIGASVRGSLALERAARAWALLGGRDYVTPVDVEELFLSVVMHRIVFTPSFVGSRAARSAGRQLPIASANSAWRSRHGRAPSSSPMTSRPSQPRSDGDVPAHPAQAGRSDFRSGASTACGEVSGRTSPGRGRTNLVTTSTRSTGTHPRGCRSRAARRSSSSASTSPTKRLASSSSATGVRRCRVFAEGWPWLSKPDAIRHAVTLIGASATAARGLLGYFDQAGGDAYWHPPRSTHAYGAPELERGFGAPEDTLLRGLRHLAEHKRDLPAGTFVFVVSDFLVAPTARRVARCARASLRDRPGDRPGPGLGAELPGRERRRRPVRRRRVGPDLPCGAHAPARSVICVSERAPLGRAPARPSRARPRSRRRRLARVARGRVGVPRLGGPADCSRGARMRLALVALCVARPRGLRRERLTAAARAGEGRRRCVDR